MRTLSIRYAVAAMLPVLGADRVQDEVPGSGAPQRVGLDPPAAIELF